MESIGDQIWWSRVRTCHPVTKTGSKGNHQGLTQACFLAGGKKIFMLLGRWQPSFPQEVSLSFRGSLLYLAREGSASPPPSPANTSVFPGVPQDPGPWAGEETWLIYSGPSGSRTGHSSQLDVTAPVPENGDERCQGWGACRSGSRCGLPHQARTCLR